MKKLIVIILLLLLLLSYSLVKLNKENTPLFYTVSMRDAYGLKSNQVSAGDDYIFSLDKDKTYNKVYANGLELDANTAQEYSLENIQEDILITFNNQYKIELVHGEGYELKIRSKHTNIVNEEESVEFQLLIESDYSDSLALVKVNDEKIEVFDGFFSVSDIKKDIKISVEGIEKNKVSAPVKPNEPAKPSEPAQPSQPVKPSEPGKTDYSKYTNSDLSWWYRLPATLNSNIQPSIEADVDALLKRHNGLWIVDTNHKTITLTMDEGYEFDNNTLEILDIAKSKNVAITFFITGAYIDSHPDLVQRMLREGHVVANHSNKHLRASPALNISDETLIKDIKELESKYKALTGQEIARLYRPPEGGYSERSLAVANDLGYKTVFWSFAYRDWLTDDQPDPEEAFNKIIYQVHPGGVFLLHAVSKTNVAILGDLIDEIRAMGYSFTSL